MRMKVALVFLLFLLFSSVSTNQMDSDREISPEENVHTALAKMAAAQTSKVSVLQQETEGEERLPFSD